jgi:hypothetical protein
MNKNADAGTHAGYFFKCRNVELSGIQSGRPKWTKMLMPEPVRYGWYSWAAHDSETEGLKVAQLIWLNIKPFYLNVFES